MDVAPHQPPEGVRLLSHRPSILAKLVPLAAEQPPADADLGGEGLEVGGAGWRARLTRMLATLAAAERDELYAVWLADELALPLPATKILEQALTAWFPQFLARGRWIPHFQPIVELATGRVAEVEALVRWECPGEGLILPGRFLAVLEGMGLARELGRWVLGMACRQARAWESRHGAAAPTVAVNLSAAEFDQPGLADEVAAALVEADLAPERLWLEITEGMAMRDAERAIGTCQALGTLGVRLALDDFGTGHSSLAHLRRLPINTLKIDRAFVRDAATGAAGLEICRTIVALARALGLGVVAEGIETVEQAHLLAATGAQWGQGYHFARPLPAGALDALWSAGIPLAPPSEIAGSVGQRPPGRALRAGP